ncbi:hypothetical protein DFH08DRAFT_934887 [Mycena albidolilacea]|uniref:Uncharacterized protein n=1 Tax=Mycena albidolilacea TaxID=1033008 RepID=A0AAD7EUF1_9AGAR|nr:hypothetical protein DFH08DRAFT_934887 [Mycena albidolilacea]
MATVKVLPVEDSSAAAAVVAFAPLNPSALIALVDPNPTPGSEEWNANKLRPPAVTPFRFLLRSLSTFPFFSVRGGTRLYLCSFPPANRLPPLFKEAKDTIAALDEETNAKEIKEEGHLMMSSTMGGFANRMRPSLVLLQGSGVDFRHWEDGEEEEVITTAPRTSGQEHTADVFSTVNPESSNPVSSISASASIEALASLNTWSISSTLDAVRTDLVAHSLPLGRYHAAHQRLHRLRILTRLSLGGSACNV